MEAVLLAIHLIVTIAMVVAILLQRSEGGALGIGGGPAGMMTSRGAADFLSKTTKWLAVVFIANALALGWLSANRDAGNDLLERASEISEQKAEEPKDEGPEG